MKKILILLLFIAFSGKLISENNIPKKDADKINFYSAKLKIIFETLYQYYDDSLNIDELSDKAFNSLLSELDPFSKYFNAKLWKELNNEAEGTKVGIGAQLFKLNDTIHIINIIPNSSADKAGLITGDKILEINDTSYVGKNGDLADEILNGDEHSLVKIKVKKLIDGKIIDLMLSREDFNISSIYSSFIIPNTKTLYLKLARFSAKSYNEMMDEMDKYSGKFNSLMLDLKDNQGGNLDQVLKITEEFTSKNDTILLLKSKSTIYDSVYINKKDGKYNKLPVITVINEKTASASEIFAGVMQDLDRGLVVGENSTGKGLVQRTWTYTDSSAFRITVAKYYTPSGRLINKSHKANENVNIPELELKMDSADIQQIKKSISKYDSKNIKVFKTRKGRTVIAAGGIIPDIYTESTKQNKLTNILKNNGYFLSYSLYWYTVMYNSFSNYKSPEEFAEKYSIDESFLANFLSYLKSKNMYNEELFESDKETILNNLKAYIAFFKWGNFGMYRIYFDNDAQIKSAVKNIENTRKMIN